MDKQTQKTMFSSKTGNWATPQEFFDKLNWRFGPFNLDPCASTHNTKCANFYTEAENGLEKTGKDLLVLLTLHMEEVLTSGLRRLIMKLRNLIQRSLCLSQRELIQSIGTDML